MALCVFDTPRLWTKAGNAYLTYKSNILRDIPVDGAASWNRVKRITARGSKVSITVSSHQPCS
ncbi:hypothetical protein MJ8_14150 [Mesorhizobium sp. J8]|nr:hypothetical protein MJ8_14150 [Mesorhizobium sp. J8]